MFLFTVCDFKKRVEHLHNLCVCDLRNILFKVVCLLCLNVNLSAWCVDSLQRLWNANARNSVFFFLKEGSEFVMFVVCEAVDQCTKVLPKH